MASTTIERRARLPRRAWGGVLKRTFSEFRADELTDWAAALTYYGILSIFPALVALLSILGGFAPGAAHQILANALHGLAKSRSGAGVVFVAGLAGALWSASGY